MSKIDLTQYGITGTPKVYHNPSWDELFIDETKPGLEGYEKGQDTELGAPADPAMQAYLQNLGNINCALGAEADVVAECCAGLPVIWKGESLYHEIMAGIFADRTFHV